MRDDNRTLPLCPRYDSGVDVMSVNQIITLAPNHRVELTGDMDVFLLTPATVDGENVNRDTHGAKRFNLVLNEYTLGWILF
jgi:hypothetical protein